MSGVSASTYFGGHPGSELSAFHRTYAAVVLDISNVLSSAEDQLMQL